MSLWAFINHALLILLGLRPRYEALDIRDINQIFFFFYLDITLLFGGKIYGNAGTRKNLPFIF